MWLSELIEKLQELREFGDFQLVEETYDEVHEFVHLTPNIKAFKEGAVNDGPLKDGEYDPDDPEIIYLVEI